MEQTAQGGVDGLRRHRGSGSAPEQPVPRKMSDEDPPVGDLDGSGSIDPRTIELVLCNTPIQIRAIGVGGKEIEGR